MEQINIRLEPEIKEKLQEVSRLERRSMTSLILYLIDKKIQEVEKCKIIKTQ